MEQFLDIESHGTLLSAERGFLIVTNRKENRQKRLAFDRLGAISISGRGGAVTKQVLQEAADRGLPLFVTDKKFSPAGWWLPIAKGHRQAKLFDAQAEAPRPLKKSLWADLVRAKILLQGTLLEAIRSSPGLKALAARVRSGDSMNMEAQAAARYWRTLFGDSFRRDRDGDGVNVALNYGYGVLRARVARAVVSAGLHPALGIFHRNQSNSMRLVDDLIEPFRPFVDFVAYRAWEYELTEVRQPVKLAFVALMNRRFPQGRESTDLARAVTTAAVSLANSLFQGKNRLDLPSSKSLKALINGENQSPFF